MKTILFICLFSALHGQTLINADFNDGLPEGWSNRFGFVESGVLSFHNRSTSTDVFSQAVDMSGTGELLLSFDFKSEALNDHNLLIGLAPVGGSVLWIAGSEAARMVFIDLGRPVLGVFSGDGSFGSHTIDFGPALALFSEAERSGMRVAVAEWLNPNVSSLPSFVDNIALSHSQMAVLPEPACEGCLIGLLVALVVWWKRKGAV